MKRFVFILFLFCSLATYANEQDSIVTDDGYVINLKDQTFSKDGEKI